MISDCDDFYGTNHPSFSWGKVTRRIVDPVTFTCYVDVTNIPRIEDCSYETTNIAISHPRFWKHLAGLGNYGGISPNHPTMSSRDRPVVASYSVLDDFASSVARLSGRGTNNEEKSCRSPQCRRKTNTPLLQSPSRTGLMMTTTQSKNKVVPTVSGTRTAGMASLGAFFSTKTFDVEDKGDADNQSVGNRSFGTRSISDRSNVELSKAEMYYKLRMRSDGTSTMSMDECRASGCFGTESTRSYMRLSDTSSVLDRSMTLIAGPPVIEADTKKDILGPSSSRTSSSSAAADDSQLLPNASLDKPARGKHTTAVILRSCIKSIDASSHIRKLDFLDEVAIWDIPNLGDKDHYRDWEAIWYDEDELAEFRNEAFMEEAGLNLEDYAMFSMKVTRRMVDPITFVERVNVECIPRMEDCFLDDQLGCSMAYFPPKHESSTPLEVRKESLPGNFRPPTPPRGPGGANSPRDPSTSPVSTRRLLKLSGSTKSSLTKKPDITILPFLSKAGERKELGEGSMSDMSVQLASLRIMQKQEEIGLKCVRFADEHDLNIISPMRNSVIAEIFWASDDLANFRYEAFMEKAGLDVSDFD